MTSLNTVVIGIRLVISFFIRGLISRELGEIAFRRMGDIRSLIQIATSFGQLGIFNGIVKYVSEYKDDKAKLQQLFSTAFVFFTIGTVGTSLAFLVFAPQVNAWLMKEGDYVFYIRLIGSVVPFIALSRVFLGVINGLSAYKRFSKIDLLTYLVSAALQVILLIQFRLEGILIAIICTPIIQFFTILFAGRKILFEYIDLKKIAWKLPFGNALFVFTIMSFVSTVLLNTVDIRIRGDITASISEEKAGIWTAMTDLSKNYMVFANALFTLYIIPKFAAIYSGEAFFKEVKNIYKTLLPIFGAGMLLVYFLRGFYVDIMHPGFDGLKELFKWQLLGDFIRLAAMILAHQFLAKKLVRNFVFTELLSLGLFYAFAKLLSAKYGVEGVVMGHLVRYIIYFIVVAFLVYRYFRKQGNMVKPTAT